MKYKQRGMVRDATIDPKEIYLHTQTNRTNIIPHSKHEIGEIAKKTPRYVATPFPPLKRL
jgi:hypothetical protein